MASDSALAESPTQRNVSPHSEVSEDSGVNSEDDAGYAACIESERTNEAPESPEDDHPSLYENLPYISKSDCSKQVYNFEGASNFSSECSIQLLGITYKKDHEFKDWDENEKVTRYLDASDSDDSPLYENLTFVTASSKPVKSSEFSSPVPMLDPPTEFADADDVNSVFEEKDFTKYEIEDENWRPGHFTNEIMRLQQFEDAHSQSLIARCRGGIVKRSSSYKSKKQGVCREGRHRHYTDSECIDINKQEDMGDESKSDHEDNDEETDLSLTLTSQNPSRIDVKTLRKKKVSKSNFPTYCIDANQFFIHEVTSEKQVSSVTLWKGKKNILNMKDEGTIMSVKGTVRGVKNRVRAGIATFLQDRSRMNYLASEAGSCVMYLTTLGIVRSTQERCNMVRKILRNMLVRYDERDVFMAREHLHSLRDRIVTPSADQIHLPQVFMHGQLLGDASAIEHLNETGELRKLLQPFQDPQGVNSVCGKCGGFGMFPCPFCDGSKKSGRRNNFNLMALKCTHCDEGGLFRCDEC